MPRTERALERDPESTRERLIDITVEHLARLGPRGVELRGICVELGVSPSLVNYYFESTGQLLWLAAVRGYEAYVIEQEAVVSTASDAETAVTHWIDGVLAWKRRCPGVAAVIDYPMLAFSAEDNADVETYAKQISELSRRNVAALGSAVYAALTGKPVRMLTPTRVAVLIRTNQEFAFWISTVGFGSQGAATWMAGRRPYSPLWKAFGFSPDRQFRATVSELVIRLKQAPRSRVQTD